MRAEDMMNLKVMDVANGTTTGAIVGMLIDGDRRQVVALEVKGGLLSRAVYLPLEDIKSIENDVLTISSPAALLEQGDFDTFRLISNISGRQVFTEKGKLLGTVHEFDVDTKNGAITFITVALDTSIMGGLWQSAGERFDIPRNLIATMGDSIVVTAEFHTKYSV